MKRLLAILCLAASSLASAQSLVTEGYREAVFSVADANAWTTLFEEVAGWKVLHEGLTDPRLIAGWQLHGTTRGREVVLGNPGTDRGFVRLVQFSRGIPRGQSQIRSNAQSWDTGGWFDVNSRVISMSKKFAELQSRNWQAASDPVEFSFGPFQVKEWLARGPDGIVIALIERMQPALEGNPHLQEMGRLFNATQIVSDIDSARKFYTDILGFSTYLDHVGASRDAGPNVLGLPHNLATEVVRHVSILHPHGTNEGSVELIEFEGATGRDFSEHAMPPNYGILMLRFPVRDMTAFAAHLEQHQVAIAFTPREVSLPPYGDVLLMGIRGPGGVWIEFFSQKVTTRT